MPTENTYQEFAPRQHFKGRHRILISLLLTAIAMHCRDEVTMLREVDTVEREVSAIFETTIAVQRASFRRRIVEEDGMWLVMGYIGQAKWVELEIDLRSRIGFRPDGHNSALNYNIDTDTYTMTISQPVILDSSYTTRVVDESASFLALWGMGDFKMRQRKLIEKIIEQQNEKILDRFKHNPAKLSELAQRLERQLALANRDGLSLRGIGRYINGKVLDQFKHIQRLLSGSISNDHHNHSQNRQEATNQKAQIPPHQNQQSSYSTEPHQLQRRSSRQQKMRSYMRSRMQF